MSHVSCLTCEHRLMWAPPHAPTTHSMPHRASKFFCLALLSCSSSGCCSACGSQIMSALLGARCSIGAQRGSVLGGRWCSRGGRWCMCMAHGAWCIVPIFGAWSLELPRPRPPSTRARCHQALSISTRSTKHQAPAASCLLTADSCFLLLVSCVCRGAKLVVKVLN
jgi:hypothetical protein